MLTSALIETLIFIHGFQVEYGISVTVRELAEGLDIGHGTAQARWNRLMEKGFLKKLTGKARTLRVTEVGIEHLKAIGKYQLSDNSSSNMIPVWGEISAGYLSEPSTEREFLEIDHLDSQRHFGLRVSGDSMINAGILNGVVAIFEKVADGYEPRSGEIVAVYVEGFGTTLKQFYRQDWKVVLRAANPLYPDQEIDTHQTFVGIQGTWTGLTQTMVNRYSQG